MKVFGTRQVEPTDEDLAALARLNAVAARFKPQPYADEIAVAPEAVAAPQEPVPDQ